MWRRSEGTAPSARKHARACIVPLNNCRTRRARFSRVHAGTSETLQTIKEEEVHIPVRVYCPTG